MGTKLFVGNLSFDVTETLGHTRLHRHAEELQVAAPEERGLDHVALSHADSPAGDEGVRLH